MFGLRFSELHVDLTSGVLCGMMVQNQREEHMRHSTFAVWLRDLVEMTGYDNLNVSTWHMFVLLYYAI
jgi:hypothetical protein